jgi:hypothetical protein
MPASPGSLGGFGEFEQTVRAIHDERMASRSTHTWLSIEHCSLIEVAAAGPSVIASVSRPRRFGVPSPSAPHPGTGPWKRNNGQGRFSQKGTHHYDYRPNDHDCLRATTRSKRLIWFEVPGQETADDELAKWS